MTNKVKPACYIASPCGFSASTKLWYDQVLLPLVGKYAEILDPWAVPFFDIVESAPGETVSVEGWLRLGKYHFDTIKNKADLMVAVLDQEPPDNGTVSEVTYAMSQGVPVIGFRNDMRNVGEPGMSYNLMVSTAVAQSGGVGVTTLEELETHLERLALDAQKKGLKSAKRELE